MIFAQYKVKCDIFYKICIFFIILIKYEPLESLKYYVFNIWSLNILFGFCYLYKKRLPVYHSQVYNTVKIEFQFKSINYTVKKESKAHI